MLTKKQKDLLVFIHTRVQETGVSPSFEEMKEALELKSKSGIHRLITALEERGFIRRLAHRARALEVLKLPDSIGALSVVDQSETSREANVLPFSPTANSPKFASTNDDKAQDTSLHGIEVPMMGRIAAGVPISAIQDHNSDVLVSPAMLGQGDHFALEVNGDSMIEEGIFDGDTVLIKETASAQNGDIVVAFIVEEEEATLKKIYKKGSTVDLVAANPAYETRSFRSDKVQVQGQLVGLIRRYH